MCRRDMGKSHWPRLKVIVKCKLIQFKCNDLIIIQKNDLHGQTASLQSVIKPWGRKLLFDSVPGSTFLMISTNALHKTRGEVFFLNQNLAETEASAHVSKTPKEGPPSIYSTRNNRCFVLFLYISSTF